MKINYCYGSLLALIIFIGGCASNTIVRSNYYDGKKLVNKTLAVAKINPDIANPDDVIDDLGKGVAQDVFEDFFSKEFASAALKNSTFYSVAYMGKPALAAFTDTIVEFQKGEQLRFAIPPKFEPARYDSLTPDFVLFIPKFSITRGDAKSGTWIPGANGGAGYYTGGSFGDLSFQITFALWDNLERRFVSYGRTDSESKILFFAMTKGDWENCTHDLARAIIKGTPFVKSR